MRDSRYVPISELKLRHIYLNILAERIQFIIMSKVYFMSSLLENLFLTNFS